MAFAGLATASAADKTAGTSIVTGTFGSNIAADSLVIVGIAKDNAATADAETSEITSVTDTLGNTYTKIEEFCNAQGAGDAGATVSLWMSVTTTLIVASVSTITANFSDSRTASAIFAQGFSKGAGTTVSSLGTGTLANDGADPGSLTSSGLSAGTEYLTVRITAFEAVPPGSITQTSGWTGAGSYTGTTGGGGASNMSIALEYIIQTGATSKASDPTIASADCASVIASFYEVSSTPVSFPPYMPGAAFIPFLVR